MSSDENDLIKAEAARYKRATDAAAKSRATLTDLVIDALRDPNAKPADIARRADWTPAYVRKLARENGIQADPAYQARTQKARERVLAEAGAGHASVPPAPTPVAAPRAAAPLIGMSEPPAELGLAAVIAKMSRSAAKILMKPVIAERPDWTTEQRAKFADVEDRWLTHALLQAAVNSGYVELPDS